MIVVGAPDFVVLPPTLGAGSRWFLIARVWITNSEIVNVSDRLLCPRFKVALS